MKRTLLRIAILLCVMAAACQTEEKPLAENTNRLIVVPSSGKTAGSTFLYMQVGHDGVKCPGCLLRHGVWIHEDCQGAGSQCSVSAALSIQYVGDALTAMTTDTFGLTSEDFFNMPARSLSTPTIGPEHYLNIPAQVVYRDSAKQQFTFTGLFYSETPAYSND